ncbi:MAG: hypothetical protein U1F30_04480 [Steroidobacteraceae bacterium]
MYQLALIMTLLPFSALGVRMGLRRLYQYGQVLYAWRRCCASSRTACRS